MLKIHIIINKCEKIQKRADLSTINNSLPRQVVFRGLDAITQGRSGHRQKQLSNQNETKSVLMETRNQLEHIENREYYCFS